MEGYTELHPFILFFFFFFLNQVMSLWLMLLLLLPGSTLAASSAARWRSFIRVSALCRLSHQLHNDPDGSRNCRRQEQQRLRSLGETLHLHFIFRKNRPLSLVHAGQFLLDTTNIFLFRFKEKSAAQKCSIDLFSWEKVNFWWKRELLNFNYPQMMLQANQTESLIKM